MPRVTAAATTLALTAALTMTGLPNPYAQGTGVLEPVSAQVITDAKKRVNIAGRQRMLTQRMTKAVCMTALGVMPDYHQDVLNNAHSDFAKALHGLRHSDESIGLLVEETNSRVLVGLEKVEDQWATFNASMSTILETGDFGVQKADVVYKENMPLLKKMNETVSLIEQAYANPNEMLLGNAVAINIAGRQRMLTQKMGKEFCLINLGWNVEAQREALNGTISLFETSHSALLNGAPTYGIIAPPTEGIRQALTDLGARWEALKPTVVKMIEGSDVSAAELDHFAEENDTLLREMHAIVGLYEAV